MKKKTYKYTCSQCEQIFTRDRRLKNTTGLFFCSKKCVYLAQKPGGVTYEIRKTRSLNKHGTEFPMSSDEIKERRRKSIRQKYGVDSTFELKSVKRKSRKTCLDRYGVETYSQTDEWNEKIKQTCLDRFGFESPIENPDILEKRNKTMIERWGGASTLESPILREKAEKTMLRKYGNRNVTYVPEIVEKSMDKKLLKTHGKTWSEYKNDLSEFQRYRAEVNHVTRQQPIYTLPNHELRGKYHLDHKFSVSQGFLKNIDPSVIGNIVNLEFIPAVENMKKRDGCSISEQTLFEAYNHKTGGSNESNTSAR